MKEASCSTFLTKKSHLKYNDVITNTGGVTVWDAVWHGGHLLSLSPRVEVWRNPLIQPAPHQQFVAFRLSSKVILSVLFSCVEQVRGGNLSLFTHDPGPDLGLIIPWCLPALRVLGCLVRTDKVAYLTRFTRYYRDYRDYTAYYLDYHATLLRTSRIHWY